MEIAFNKSVSLFLRQMCTDILLDLGNIFCNCKVLIITCWKCMLKSILPANKSASLEQKKKIEILFIFYPERVLSICKVRWFQIDTTVRCTLRQHCSGVIIFTSPHPKGLNEPLCLGNFCKCNVNLFLAEAVNIISGSICTV